MNDQETSINSVTARILNEKICLLPKATIKNANTPKTTQRELIMEKTTCI